MGPGFDFLRCNSCPYHREVADATNVELTCPECGEEMEVIHNYPPRRPMGIRDIIREEISWAMPARAEDPGLDVGP